MYWIELNKEKYKIEINKLVQVFGFTKMFFQQILNFF